MIGQRVLRIAAFLGEGEMGNGKITPNNTFLGMGVVKWFWGFRLGECIVLALVSEHWLSHELSWLEADLRVTPCRRVRNA